MFGGLHFRHCKEKIFKNENVDKNETVKAQEGLVGRLRSKVHSLLIHETGSLWGSPGNTGTVRET